MKKTVIGILLAISVGCGPTKPPDTAANQGESILVTIKAAGAHPQMDMVLQFTPALDIEPDINWLAQNLLEARKKCCSQDRPFEQDKLHLDLTLIDGIVQRQVKQLESENSLLTCFYQSLSDATILQSDRGIRKLKVDITLQTVTATPTNSD
ncbi:MAG TPA: hypothetical protein PLC97_02020 [Myxococcota bacterium]|nr:hypothetical protein [Myxococcota bacterium]